jgi:hypothetical protein
MQIKESKYTIFVTYQDSSSSKYVPPHSRHIKGKGNIICKNANHNSAENRKKHSNKKKLVYLSSLRHHRSHPIQMPTAPQVEGSKEATN